LARFELNLGPAGYGFLFGSLGAGAITAAAVLPRLRRNVSLDLLVAEGTLLFAFMVLLLAFLPYVGLIALQIQSIVQAFDRRHGIRLE
jgi:hypothetical protein